MRFNGSPVGVIILVLFFLVMAPVALRSFFRRPASWWRLAAPQYCPFCGAAQSKLGQKWCEKCHEGLPQD